MVGEIKETHSVNVTLFPLCGKAEGWLRSNTEERCWEAGRMRSKEKGSKGGDRGEKRREGIKNRKNEGKNQKQSF